MKKLLLLLVFPLTGCTTGMAMMAMEGTAHCPPSAFQVAQYNAVTLQSVQAGDSRNILLSSIGIPEQVKEVTVSKGDIFEVFFYRTGHKACRSMPTNEEYTPVVLKEGVVIGKGQFFYVKHIAPNVVNQRMVRRDARNVNPLGGLVYPFNKAF